MNWIVDHLRYTAFYEAGADEGGFERLLGVPATRSAIDKSAGTRTEETDISERYTLKVVTDVSRQHVVLHAKGQALDRVAGVVALHDLEDALSVWRPIALKAQTGATKPVNRVAVACAGIREAASHADAYAFLRARLPFLNLNWDNAREFSFQINVPTAPNGEGIEYNRLGKWAAYKGLIVPPDGLPKTVYFSRLELDFSTPAERAEALTKEQIASTFEAMLAELCRTASGEAEWLLN